MRTAKIGWATSLLLGCAAVTLSGCLTKTKNVPGPTTSVTVAAPNKTQQLLRETDYGSDGSEIEAAVGATTLFYFAKETDHTGEGQTPSTIYKDPSIYASQSSNSINANVKYADSVNAVQFLELDFSTQRDDSTQTDNATVTISEVSTDTVPFSRLSSKFEKFTDVKKPKEFGRKGTRYNILHNKANGNAIALFVTESKYLKDYDSDDDNAEMFAGGYWVELSQDSDGKAVVEAAGVFSDAKGLTRGRDTSNELVWLTDENNSAITYDASGTEVTATYMGKTEGGYSEKSVSGAGAFTGEIELVAKLFGTNSQVSGNDPATAGTVSGTVDGIKLWAFQDFGNNVTDLSGVTVTLNETAISLLGTFGGSVNVGTVSGSGKWGGIFSNTTVNTGAPHFVIGTYGFEHSGTKDRAFLGHFGLANPN